MSLQDKLTNRWARLWMLFSGPTFTGRLATRIAGLWMPPYRGRSRLAYLCRRGYIAPTAVVHRAGVKLGRHIFIGERATLYAAPDGGGITIGDGSALHQDSIIETGQGGTVAIGAHTHIQARAQLSAYLGSITIGDGVQIAPGCAFYPYDHGTVAGVPMREQPLTTQGGIVLEDDAWLGYGVVVLDGVTVGRGAVIGAGSVVTKSIPANAIAAGVPARVIGTRKAQASQPETAVRRPESGHG